MSSADAVVAAWDPNASSASFEAMAVAGDAVYVAGGFQTIGELPRTSVAKLDTLTGAAIPAFDASGLTQAMALSIGDGELSGGVDSHGGALQGSPRLIQCMYSRADLSCRCWG